MTRRGRSRGGGENRGARRGARPPDQTPVDALASLHATPTAGTKDPGDPPQVSFLAFVKRGQPRIRARKPGQIGESLGLADA